MNVNAEFSVIIYINVVSKHATHTHSPMNFTVELYETKEQNRTNQTERYGDTHTRRNREREKE